MRLLSWFSHQPTICCREQEIARKLPLSNTEVSECDRLALSLGVSILSGSTLWLHNQFLRGWSSARTRSSRRNDTKTNKKRASLSVLFTSKFGNSSRPHGGMHVGKDRTMFRTIMFVVSRRAHCSVCHSLGYNERRNKDPLCWDSRTVWAAYFTLDKIDMYT